MISMLHDVRCMFVFVFDLDEEVGGNLDFLIGISHLAQSVRVSRESCMES